MVDPVVSKSFFRPSVIWEHVLPATILTGRCRQDVPAHRRDIRPCFLSGLSLSEFLIVDLSLSTIIAILFIVITLRLIKIVTEIWV